MAYPDSTVPFEKMLFQFMTAEDPMLAMLEWLCAQLMEVEITTKIGAAKSERNTSRNEYRAGYRPRRFDTRMGTIYLMVPKPRKGGYVPFFVSERKRSEAALMSVIQEAFVNGVSTRKIERLAKALGIQSISKGQVSQITKELNDQVTAFRSRTLDKEYPVLWVDALYEKIRVDGHVRNMAVHVVCGLRMDGTRDIITVDPMYEESEASYNSLFASLKARGLEKVWLVVSDAHKGLVAAVSKSFLGASWQRCKVHFMRNIMAHIPAKEKELFAGKLKQIWNQPDRQSARHYAKNLMDEYENRFPRAVEILEQGLEDSLQYLSYEQIDPRKISSTNLLERLNREIRRRTTVVGIFPSMDSYIRLVTTYLMEYSEDWSTSRAYVDPKVLARVSEIKADAA
jgi:transposase-like protein